VKDALSDIGARVTELLASESTINNLQPESLRAAVLAYPARVGKALRPALCLWSCGLYRDPPPAAWRLAAAIELYHIWTLVHDDIIDQDLSRRGGPSAHEHVRRGVVETDLAFGQQARVFGKNIAILAGDIQHAWSNYMILQAVDEGMPPSTALVILRRLNGFVNPMLIGGEALDVEFELSSPLLPPIEKILEMLRGKTAILLRFAAESGVLLGLETDDIDHPMVAAAGSFAEAVGIAFQLRDDILGMYGNAAQLGKPVGSDVRQGKPTVLYAEALARTGGDDRATLERALGHPELTPVELDQVRDIIRSCGARDAVDQRIASYIVGAVAILDQLPPGKSNDSLRWWADYAVTRDS
jgi:geranylgeranyl diphosphate synthase type I